MAVIALRHKHVQLDQRKLDRARRALGARTETETLDRALDIVVTEADIDRVLRSARGRARSDASSEMRRIIIIDTNLYIDWLNVGRHEDVLFQRDAVSTLSAVVMLAASMRGRFRLALDASSAGW